ncbi:MAG: hypothetical protein WC651_00520 [Candidatus Gracilibacteria bacterium]|jgi:hypothetical protein
MKIVITTDKSKSLSLLSKISMLFFGAFLTAIIWMLLSKCLGEYGIGIGLWLMVILIFLGLKKTQKGTYPRIIVYGMMAATIFAFTITMGFFLLMGLA